jgi:hypothetical protein
MTTSLFLLPHCVLAYVNARIMIRITTSNNVFPPPLYYSSDSAQQLPMDENARQQQPPPPLSLIMSASDWARLQSLRHRQVTLPVMMMRDVLLPNQVITLQSSDPTFRSMLHYSMTECGSRVAVIGQHPFAKNGRPLSFGVLAKVETLPQPQFSGFANQNTAAVTVRITALHRVQLQSQPEDHGGDDDSHFSVAECEVLTDDERLSPEVAAKAAQLAAILPTLIEQWKETAIAAKNVGTDEADGRERVTGEPQLSLETSLDVHKYWTALAFYTAALLCPSTTTALARNTNLIDIRPAMLTAATSYERLLLAVTALQCQCDGL